MFGFSSSAGSPGVEVGKITSDDPNRIVIESAALGRIVVDGRSHTLYLFEQDKRGKSTCSGACAQNWPPLLTKGAPKAGAG